MGFTDYLINERAVVCGLEADNWEDAIIKGGQILVEKGAATQEYLRTIVKKCKDNGPYIVIAPRIAMPHARPEEGALALGYALVTLKNPVSFMDPDNDPISLLIYIAAPDVKAHNEEAICQVADLCDEEEYVDGLIEAKSEEEMIQILKRSLNED
ncbi:MAG: PTS sugar transporter subunit IIA [Spirochaetales bacterium]|nr:PTS sugar transporter subunit IIA [Spirochaetales bacterium]